MEDKLKDMKIWRKKAKSIHQIHNFLRIHESGTIFWLRGNQIKLESRPFGQDERS
jgi:hypothetical protein